MAVSVGTIYNQAGLKAFVQQLMDVLAAGANITLVEQGGGTKIEINSAGGGGGDIGDHLVSVASSQTDDEYTMTFESMIGGTLTTQTFAVPSGGGTGGIGSRIFIATANGQSIPESADIIIAGNAMTSDIDVTLESTTNKKYLVLNLSNRHAITVTGLGGASTVRAYNSAIVDAFNPPVPAHYPPPPFVSGMPGKQISTSGAFPKEASIIKYTGLLDLTLRTDFTLDDIGREYVFILENTVGETSGAEPFNINFLQETKDGFTEVHIANHGVSQPRCMSCKLLVAGATSSGAPMFIILSANAIPHL